MYHHSITPIVGETKIIGCTDLNKRKKEKKKDANENSSIDRKFAKLKYVGGIFL